MQVRQLHLILFTIRTFRCKKDDTFNFEPKKATKLLKELKLKDRDEDGILEDESGNPVTLRILVQNTNKQRLEAAETIIET